jgi:ribosomal protein S18 acetylase RimI-like enzyme
MDEAVRTRRASVADLDALVPLFDGYRIFYRQPSDQGLARAFLEDRMTRGESIVFVAEAGGEAIGFAQLYPSFSSVRARRIYSLNDLFVRADARRRGAARALLDQAVSFARDAGAARLTLSTAVDNRTAQSCYEKAGWQRDEAFYVYNLSLVD